MAKKSSTSNNLLLKIPLFISEIQESSTGTLFDLTKNDIIGILKSRIDNYHHNGESCIFGKKGKSEAVSIAEILSEDIQFDKEPALLLRISTERTNLCGGIIQHKDKERGNTTLDYSDTITVPTNIVVLYPQITASKRDKNKIEWFVYIFVYEDPSKPNVDMCQLARQMMRNVFNIPIRNIKQDKFCDEIQSSVENFKLEVILSNFEDASEYELPDNLKKYSYSVKAKNETFINVENISAEDAASLICDSSFPTHKQKIFKFLKSDKRKLTAKITERVKDAKITFEYAFEDCFNFEVEVNENDLKTKKLFESETIKQNIERLLKQI